MSQKITDKANRAFRFKAAVIIVLTFCMHLSGCTHMVRVGDIPNNLTKPKEKLNAKVLLVISNDIANYTYKNELALDSWVIPIGTPVSESLRQNIPRFFKKVLQVDLRQETKHQEYLYTLRPTILSFKTSTPPQNPYQSWAKITLKMDVLDANDKIVFSKIASGYGVAGTSGPGISPIHTGDKDFDAGQLAYLFSTVPKVDFASKNSLAASSRTAIYNGIVLLLNSIYDAKEFDKHRT